MQQVTLECAECGCRAFIWRRKSKLKERAHVNHLWCRRCQERTAHVEVREG